VRAASGLSILPIAPKIPGEYSFARTEFAAPIPRSSPEALAVLSGCTHCTVKINLQGKEHILGHLLQAFLSQTGLVFGRSFVPLFAIVVIAGVMLWGPWVSLAITAVAITLAMRML
jgi:hypothetical protein